MNVTAKSSQTELIEAAKTVVSLSGWGKRDGLVYQTSFMAIEVLRSAIKESENPQLTLAPEPIPQGI